MAATTVLAKFWILDPLYTALGTLLAWFYAVIPSFGVAIILLTVAVRLVTLPLTAKQARSQQAIQRLQPELKRLQAKYKGDRQKLNEEMMKFYKEHKVNPLGGCLPLLIQMPILIVLYRLILDLSQTPPKHVPTSSSLFEALVASGGRMPWFGMDLAEAASSVSGGDQAPYLVLIAIVVATGYLQQRQISGRMPKDGANSQMQTIMKIFPIFFGVISYTIPAGVVVYFATSNIWQIGQQAVLFRNQPPPPVEPPDKKSSQAKKGPGPTKKLPAGGKSSASGKRDAKTKGNPASGGRQKQEPRRSGGGANNQRKKNVRGPGRANQARKPAEGKNPRGKNQPRKDNE